MFFRRKKKKDQSETPNPASLVPGEDLREQYRRTPGKNHALGVMLQLSDTQVNSGELIDVSAGGAGVRFTAERDPGLEEGSTSKLLFSSLVHAGQIAVDVRVVRLRDLPENGKRYGFEFLNVDKLFAQLGKLDSYYYNFFNRRRRVRVRPALDAKVPLKLESGDVELDVLINDLSVSGVGFVLNGTDVDKLKSAREVDISFKIPKTDKVIACHSQLRHATQLSKGTLIGIQLTPVDPGKFEKQKPALEKYVKAREVDMARWDSAYS